MAKRKRKRRPNYNVQCAGRTAKGHVRRGYAIRKGSGCPVKVTR